MGFKKPFSLPLFFLSILREKHFFVDARSGPINQAHFSVRGTLLRWNNTRRICESERWKNNDVTKRNRTTDYTKTKCPVSPIYVSATISATADFCDESRQIETRRAEKALIQRYGFLMRASCRACSRLYAKYGRIFRNCSGATAGLEAPTGDMHISSGRNEYIIHNLFRTLDL